MTDVDRVVLTADAMLVTLTGAIGPREVDDVVAALAEAERVPMRRYVVDCTNATIDDPDALAALYGLAATSRARDGLVAVVTPRDSALALVLATTGLDAAVSVYATRARALGDLDLPDPHPAQ